MIGHDTQSMMSYDDIKVIKPNKRGFCWMDFFQHYTRIWQTAFIICVTSHNYKKIRQQNIHIQLNKNYISIINTFIALDLFTAGYEMS